jgi:hypothetical protein
MGNNLPINAAYPDRVQIIDALYRLVTGIDDNDPALLTSSLTSDCHVDYQKAGQIMGLSFPVFDDRDAAAATVLALVGPLDTLHREYDCGGRGSAFPAQQPLTTSDDE